MKTNDAARELPCPDEEVRPLPGPDEEVQPPPPGHVLVAGPCECAVTKRLDCAVGERTGLPVLPTVFTWEDDGHGGFQAWRVECCLYAALRLLPLAEVRRLRRLAQAAYVFATPDALDALVAAVRDYWERELAERQARRLRQLANDDPGTRE
jgi:hypothetical protein